MACRGNQRGGRPVSRPGARKRGRSIDMSDPLRCTRPDVDGDRRMGGHLRTNEDRTGGSHGHADYRSGAAIRRRARGPAQRAASETSRKASGGFDRARDLPFSAVACVPRHTVATGAAEQRAAHACRMPGDREEPSSVRSRRCAQITSPRHGRRREDGLQVVADEREKIGQVSARRCRSSRRSRIWPRTEDIERRVGGRLVEDDDFRPRPRDRSGDETRWRCPQLS